MECAVGYYRVSTKQQHRSGLGIEAQRDAVARFAESERFQLLHEYVEAETGNGADALDRRPQLAAALAAARAAKGPVIVSKLDWGADACSAGTIQRTVNEVEGPLGKRMSYW